MSVEILTFGCRLNAYESELMRDHAAALTNTVMTANDDGEAEQIRRGWLGEELIVHNVCTAGYVIETRQLAEPSDAPSSNAHDVVYSGRCL